MIFVLKYILYICFALKFNLSINTLQIITPEINVILLYELNFNAIDVGGIFFNDMNKNAIKWKKIIGYEGYLLSNKGVVVAQHRKIKCKNNIVVTKNKVVLKQGLTEKGYARVYLSKNNIKKTFRVHRLVAIHFIKNTKKYLEINHKDGNKLNNNVNNLEWCTRKQNMQHAYSVLKIVTQRTGKENNMSVPVLNLKTGKIYETIKDAAKSVKMNRGTLQAMLSGRNKNKTNFIKHESSDENVVNEKFN